MFAFHSSGSSSDMHLVSRRDQWFPGNFIKCRKFLTINGHKISICDKNKVFIKLRSYFSIYSLLLLYFWNIESSSDCCFLIKKNLSVLNLGRGKYLLFFNTVYFVLMINYSPTMNTLYDYFLFFSNLLPLYFQYILHTLFHSNMFPFNFQYV